MDPMTMRRKGTPIKYVKGKGWVPLSWKPRRRGKIYCAPACGGGCTRVAFDQATARAAGLAKRLTRWYADNDPVKNYMIASMPRSRALRTWTPVVKENMGWHWSVVSPCQQIRVRGAGKEYSAWFTPTGHGQFIADADTPEKAVEAALDLARSRVAGLSDALALAMKGRTW